MVVTQMQLIAAFDPKKRACGERKHGERPFQACAGTPVVKLTRM
jgi:hypothetical protein